MSDIPPFEKGGRGDLQWLLYHRHLKSSSIPFSKGGISTLTLLPTTV